MIIKTSRFGNVEVQESDVFQFTEGLLGFADLRKFILIDDPGDEIFAWLQSCETPSVAFPVLEPSLFNPGHKVTLTKGDLESLKLEESAKGVYFTIVTIPEDPTQMTANMKAPIAINPKEKLARQCVLQDNALAIREPIFLKLQARVMQNSTVALKHQTSAMDVATKLRTPEAGL